MKSVKTCDLILLSMLICICVCHSAEAKSADFCGADTDCNSVNFCNWKLEKCVHFPLTKTNMIELVGLFFIQFLLIFTVSAGLHSGAIILPVLVFFLGFDVKEAIPLIKAASFFGAVVYFILQRRAKHPNRDAPAVDFSVVLMITPILLLGTLTGLNASLAVPSWIVLTVSLCFLIYFTCKTISKGVVEYRNEQREKAEEKRISEEKEILQFINSQQNFEDTTTKYRDDSTQYKTTRKSLDPFAKLETFEIHEEDDHMLEVYESHEYEEEIAEIEQRMKQVTPWRTLTILATLVAVFILFFFLRGSTNMNSFAGIQPGSINYWYAYISFLGFCLCSAFLIGYYLTSQQKRRCKIGFQFVQHDIHWNWKLAIILSVYSFFLGLIGPIGIGSSSLTVPLLLDIGLSKEQVSSTNTFINIIAGFSIGFEFIASGLLDPEWALLLAAMCVVSVFIAVFVMRTMLRHLGSVYVLVIILGTLLCAGSGLIIYSTVLNINMINERGLNMWSFAQAC